MGEAVYRAVVGQQRAVANLQAAARKPVHAYLLVGPFGVGVREAASSFAADVLCSGEGCGACRSCEMALGGRHPDLIVVERKGAKIDKEQITEIIRLAVRPPVEGRFKVIVLVDFHLIDQQYAKLLKTIEEPPPSTVFVILAERVPPELVTIASRCVRIDFSPVETSLIAAALVGDGVATDAAGAIASASAGRIERARLLAGDPGFTARQEAWRQVPQRLDGTGAAIAELADQLLASIETVLEPLKVRHATEMSELEQRIQLYGERGSGRKELEDRHKREVRRVQTDELRFGMATLAAAYRDSLVGGGSVLAPPARAMTAIRALDRAGESLVRNPNPTLLLQGLLISLTETAGA